MKENATHKERSTRCPKILIITQSALEEDREIQGQIRCCWLATLGFTLYVACATEGGECVLKKPDFSTELTCDIFASADNLGDDLDIQQLVEQHQI